MPRIAIDTSPLYDGNSVRGVGYYTQNLVNSLQEEVKVNPEYKDYIIDLVTNPDDLKSASYDLIHYPFFDPFKLTLPSHHSCPFVITIHDLIPIEFSEHFPVGIKGFLKWQLQRYQARQAKYIFTVSHYSKFSISKYLPYPQDRIYPTYLAADDNFHPIDDKKFLSSIKAKYNLPDKFVLFVGDINWNKNVPTLVNACISNNYPLVIVGSSAVKDTPIHPWTTDIHWLQQKHKDLGGNSSQKLILTGFVPDCDLPALFNLATMYCQPSFAEGFGLPLVQAMQSGTPVVYPDRGAMAEIMDYSGQMFNPESQKSLSQALSYLWDDADASQRLISKGLARVSSFKWQLTALQTLAVYQLALIDEKH